MPGTPTTISRLHSPPLYKSRTIKTNPTTPVEVYRSYLQRLPYSRYNKIKRTPREIHSILSLMNGVDLLTQYRRIVFKLVGWYPRPLVRYEDVQPRHTYQACIATTMTSNTNPPSPWWTILTAFKRIPTFATPSWLAHEQSPWRSRFYVYSIATVMGRSLPTPGGDSQFLHRTAFVTNELCRMRQAQHFFGSVWLTSEGVNPQEALTRCN